MGLYRKWRRHRAGRQLANETERVLRTGQICPSCGAWRCPQCGNLILIAPDHGVACSYNTPGPGFGVR